jgi:uncharacterized membrane protein YedE/YeeE
VALLGTAIPAPEAAQVGRGLVLGSVLFGAGWGLAGLCPGPSLAALSYNGAGGAIFVAAMVAGMLAAVPLRARLASPAAVGTAAE